MATDVPAREEAGVGPIIAPGHTFGSITDKISSIVQGRPVSRSWLLGFGASFLLVLALFNTIGLLLLKGVGIWGINIPVGWGFAIVNFVWWIGIGHAGTLISAILLLLRQKWRTSINRFAEAMTLFAVACAGLFPLLHMGRPWFAYWLFPYPNPMELWPQWRSPLVWDVFAVSTYATVSLLFWFVGLIPDMATLRDRSTSPLGRVGYGILAMGWRGSAVHWQRYETAYLLLAGLATPLVVSVHTVVSFDFAVSIVPGWHTTIFPPYFVAGAIYSGFAMVLTLAIPIRYFYGLQDFITLKHLDNMAKIMLTTGLVVAYGYGIEAFMAWYSDNIYEKAVMVNRVFGPYNYMYWALIACNVVAPQFLWSRAVRRDVPLLFVLAIIVNVGMWLERYVIVVISLSRDYIPSSWGMYAGTFWDWSMYLGTIGLFLALLFLFIRFLPMISIFEMRTLLPEAQVHGGVRAAHPGHESPGHGRGPGDILPGDTPREGRPGTTTLPPYGLVAEFESAADLVRAAAAARDAGYRRMDAYSPFPIEDLTDALGQRPAKLPLVVLLGGILGGLGGYFLQYYTSVHTYPLNVGGRPFNSWPMFIPVTFECTVLGAALAAVFGMLGLNGLPMPYHPLFHIEQFARASRDRFFLCIRAADPRFDLAVTRQFLEGLHPREVTEVPQ
jgi:molybdopterin-containing oxidoreductase family membrane subunit